MFGIYVRVFVFHEANLIV